LSDLDDVLPQLYNGYAIRRTSWPEHWAIIRVGEHQFKGPNGSAPSHQDILANDWVVRAMH